MSWPTDPTHTFELDRGAISVALAPDGGLLLKVRERTGDPVESSPAEFRRLALALLQFSELEEARRELQEEARGETPWQAVRHYKVRRDGA